jgi:hypothetical protein
MELKMNRTIETVGKLLIFIFLFGTTFVASPYLATHQTYTESSSVSPLFPIAILDDGTPDIVRWREYQENVDLYKDKIISAPTQEKYKLNELEFFTLTSAPNNVLNLSFHTEDYNFGAEYSVRNGIVKPISFRYTGAFVIIGCFAVALTGTPMIGWAYKRYIRSRSTKSRNKTRAILAEYTRPWKVFTLSLGIALLILGSFYYQAPDWDIPISFIMAILAYLTAPWSLRVILERRWRLWPAMLFATWFTVDGSYWLYWHFKNPVVLELMRSVNFPASLSLYGMCGIVWLYRGSLRQLVSEIQNHSPLMRGNRALKRAESVFRENHNA